MTGHRVRAEGHHKVMWQKILIIERGEELGPFCNDYNTVFYSSYFVGLKGDIVHALIGFMDPVPCN